MSAHATPSAKVAMKVLPELKHVCTSNPMILIQYHTTRRAAEIFIRYFFIRGAKVQISVQYSKFTFFVVTSLLVIIYET